MVVYPTPQEGLGLHQLNCAGNPGLSDLILHPLSQGGNLSDALVDLTGGVSAHLDLTLGGYGEDFEKRKQLFKMMRKEMDEHALMCCAIAVSAAASLMCAAI